MFLIHNGISMSKISIYGYISDNVFFRRLRYKSKEKALLQAKPDIAEDKKVVICVSKHSLREAPFDTLKAFSLLNDQSLHLIW